MWRIPADLVVGIFDLLADVFLLRAVRRQRGHRERELAEDAYEVARFDFVTLLFISLACVGLMLLLTFGFGLSAGWSAGIGIAVGTAWGLWRYAQLVRGQ
uniref:hypothetical protein n=1 Tax=unclassified Variovorax TaxID=663243 RepID=UPI000D3AE21E